MLDQTQLVAGVSVLMSFFVGYRYALRVAGKDDEQIEELSKSVKTKTAKGSAPRGEYKMVLVVRNDLKMGKGKIGAQCGHASVGAYQRAMDLNPGIVRRWDDSGCAKICVKVESEKELAQLRKVSSQLGLNFYLVHDAGRTQIAAGSATVLAIGPALVDQINQVTGHLKLL